MHPVTKKGVADSMTELRSQLQGQCSSQFGCYPFESVLRVGLHLFRLSEAIVLGIPQAVAFISRQIVDAIVYSFLLLVTLGVLFVAIVFREPPRL